MSDIIAKVQRTREMAQNQAERPVNRVTSALQSLSQLTLSDLNASAAKQVEARLAHVNHILSDYEFEDFADYEHLDEADAQQILELLDVVAQLCIESEAARVMDELREGFHTLPVAAIKEVRQHPDIFVPLLIGAVREAVETVRKGEECDGNAAFFACFLLTELEVDDALPVLLELYRLPGEGPFDLIGDAAQSLTTSSLALFSRGSTGVIADVVADRSVNQYVRWSAAQAYKLLVRDGVISREVAIAALDRHLKECVDNKDIDLIGAIVCELCDLAAESSLEAIRAAFERELVDKALVNRTFVEAQIAAGDQTVRSALGSCSRTGVPDTIAELGRWAAFRERPASRRPPEPLPPPIAKPHFSTFENSGRRPVVAATARDRAVGRNEPCPCGSGKKFKKCCL